MSTNQLKNEILTRLIEAFYANDFAEEARLIPFVMRPKGHEVPFRCCIYKERAILRDRTIAGLGFSIEATDESERVARLAKKALEREVPEKNPLTILQTACQACVPARIYVTDLCQGCVARECKHACKFDAITISDNKSSIDPAKCKNCGLCVSACPYQAIAKRIVPCEKACPVDAIFKDESGEVKIDFDNCIFCGKCVGACPFGAVHEKSQIIDVLKQIKSGAKVVAMVAPAIMGQFECTPQQLKSAIQKLGFNEVYEVAQGADITIKNETDEFEQRLEEGAEFMTTSCCASYNEFVKKHLPGLQPFVSHTKTPLYYTAELVKKEHPDAVTVFFAPCVAKRIEAAENPNVNYVINYEELNAWFNAGTNGANEWGEGSDFKYNASAGGRGFAGTGGVAKAVQSLLPDDIPTQALIINGLDKESIKSLKTYAKTGECDAGNLIEVMACTGGCLGGNATVSEYKAAAKRLEQYVEKE